MTPAARVSAAIEIVADIEAQRRPAADVLKDWGLSHRFAGSSDRAGIAGLVYDTLRRKSSSAWLIGETSARAAVIGMLHRERGLGVEDIAELCSGARFAPAPLTDAERTALAGDRLGECAGACARRLSGMARSAPLRGCSATSAPTRARRLRAGRRSICASTRSRPSARRCCPACRILRAEPTRWSPHGLRIKLSADAKNPAIHAEPAFLKGTVEIQDEGSQLAALLVGRQARRTGGRSRAGAGGKTLALAAMMDKQRPDLRHRHRQAAAGADP